LLTTFNPRILIHNDLASKVAAKLLDSEYEF